ncbi:biotin carboxylase N-terminal domain-containing protein [Bdellovibrio bacteriovorus]|uniref:Pyruvate carboxylase n=1 Tax=Bdellovibrio bacteriovorus (strain ATCC 15356 / DSM 50701 / NCIMB 9529 / HD100) TaxID=264462 RepID=Q6MHG7_BDEBA|nr:biotin carboxylase N-terminal domain-containing protein [Bdellovibrio bacteriovorus]AHZ83927.1 pyruvate carboxylase subunit A [Bdellovibrio bacteriovorus]BEV69903.1 Biotin carboxylase [Bdellovibrio bacteriovorus]CAE80960.1 pyruvate carboxylase [Bdellovibrio bacteriovorus HD100]
MKKFTRIAIANRGEVAVRIIKACEEMGIETVLLHSEADINTRAYRMATKTICVGPAATAESYLNIPANINGALAGGAQAVHPGFGFLSENADFAEAVNKAGLTFIGPSPEAIRALGDKVHCKELAKQAGLPLVPGYQGENQDVAHLITQAEKIGYPVIVKAAAGGGGRGMKLLKSSAEAHELIESAQREAQSAFGSPKVFLEKYLDRAKHIEFQVFGDSTGNVQHFFDRECSVQRRHQKIIEEATSPSLTDDLRRRMGEAACAIATLGKYKGAGTVEFLLQDGEFYLLEVNTRLQVEHPVTEEVLGVDLVKMQILTAQGDFVHDNKQIRAPKGHSIECRIYAENPFLGGVPSTGLLGHVEWPEGPGRRYEYGFDSGDTITPYYDPMIAKVIVWDENRPRAIQKMIRVLKDSVVFGVHTNIPYLIEILSHKEFVMGTMTTRFIETYFSESLKEPALTEIEKTVAAGALLQLRGGAGETAKTSASPWASYWRGI